jgi:hypothetical protein
LNGEIQMHASLRARLGRIFCDACDGGFHLIEVDFMDVDGVGDLLEHGEGEAAAEVLAELFEAGEEFDRIVKECVRGGEVEGAEGGEDLVEGFLGEVEGEVGVGGVDGEAEGDGFAVAELEMGEGFDSVGEPMAEVEGAGLLGFERIAILGDVVEVEAGGMFDGGLGGAGIAGGDFWRVIGKAMEEVGVFDEGDFHRFGEAGAEIAIGERGQHGCIVDDGPGDGKSAEPIFAIEEVDGVFDADAAVSLPGGGGREADEPDAAMGEGGGEADGIEESAAADGEEIGAAIDGVVEDRLEDGEERGRIIFDRFAAGEGEVGGEGAGGGMISEFLLEAGEEMGGGVDAFFDDSDQFGGGAGVVVQEMQEGGEIVIEDVLSEADAVGAGDGEGDVEGSGGHGGRFQNVVKASET